MLYRRHGVMSRWRALSLAGFLYYAISTVCMTVVPLPKRTADMCATFAPVAHPQWIPGNTFRDIWKEAHHQITPGALVIHNPAVAGRCSTSSCSCRSASSSATTCGAASGRRRARAWAPRCSSS
ncbi:hypothetical protein NKH77_27465 [Streptomyces sp. M19]